MMKKIVALLLTLAMVLGLAACGGNNGENSGKNSGDESDISSKWDNLDWSKGADASDGDVTLCVTSWRQYDKEYYEEIARRFEEKYDWINVEIEITASQSAYYSNLQADILSGDAPDIMDLHPDRFIEYVNDDLLAPQTDFDYLERYNEAGKAITTVAGENYGFLLGYNYFGFIYNVVAFNKCGISVPTTPEELVAAVNALKKAGYGGISYPGATITSKIYRNIMQICLGNDIQDMYKSIDDGSLVDLSTVEGIESAFKTMEYYTDNDIFYTAFEGISYDAATSLFAQKKSAILYQGTYALGEAEESFPDVNFGYFPIPTYSGNSLNAAEGAQSACISSQCENLGAAKLWVEFLATEEISTYFSESTGMLSTIEGVTTEDEITPMVLASSEGCVIHSMNNIKYEAYWSTAFSDCLFNILCEDADWKEEVDYLKRKLEEIDLSSL